MSSPEESAPLSWASAAAFRRYFWQPPRAHGDVIEGREVSFLELFYDLVYVVAVSQAGGHLAGDVTWAGVGRFAVLFGLKAPEHMNQIMTSIVGVEAERPAEVLSARIQTLAQRARWGPSTSRMIDTAPVADVSGSRE